MSDKQHVMGAAAEASEPALVNQAPAGLGATRFDQARGRYRGPSNRDEIGYAWDTWEKRYVPLHEVWARS